MRIFLFILLCGGFFNSYSIQCESIKNGNWNSSSTWKNSLIPNNNDSVVVLHEIIFNKDSIELQYLKLNANLKFSNSFILKTKVLENNTPITISSNYFMGNIQIDSLFLIQSICNINNVNIYSKGDCIIFGQLNLNAENNIKSFKNIEIENGGTWKNNSNSDPRIYGNIKNNGTFKSCNNTGCTYRFYNNSILKGDSALCFTRIYTNNNIQILNQGTLNILLSIDGDARLINEKTLILNTSEQAFHVSELNTSAPLNIVIYNDTNEQYIYRTNNGFYQNLIVKNGRKILTENLFVKKELYLQDSSILAQQTFSINGLNSATLNIDSSSCLSIGSNDFVQTQGFPINFKQLNLHPYSTILYQAKGNENINSTISYGNLVIDDGAVTESIKTIDKDSLRIRGNLWIAESSVRLKCNLCDIICQGNWDGIGNLEMLNGTFQLKGDGNNYGKLYPGNGKIIYNGDKNQTLKIGDYHQLIINKKSGKALLKGNVGIFKCKFLINEKSVFEIGNETVIITDSLINKDQLYFMSNQQSRSFKHILNTNNASIQFKVPASLTIKGNWLNKGSFICGNGKVIFADSTQQQSIEGNNIFNILEINKNKSSLALENNVELQNEIKIISGKLNLQNKTLYLQNNSKITGENSQHYIYGNNGKITLNKEISAGVNDSANGIGLLIQPSVNWGLTQFVRKHFIYNIDGDNSIRRQYEIHPTNDSNLNEKVSFYYLPHELENNSKNLFIYKSKDEQFWNKLIGIQDTSKHFISIENIVSFSTWTFKSLPSNPLPVTWLDLNFSHNNEITWATASEINSEYFDVQISYDGLNFINAKKLNACGDCNTINEYACDLNLEVLTYIRIKCTDKDGNESFSKIIIFTPTYSSSNVYSSGNLIYIENFESSIDFELYDSKGDLVFKKKISDSQQIESRLPNGIYFYKMGEKSGKLILLN